ncbi:hypothetical protein GCM10010270_75660 [Streptomyces violaceus]|nr:hypothetical protein GCM10010270_75660 [Streptomyces janthinus]
MLDPPFQYVLTVAQPTRADRADVEGRRDVLGAQRDVELRVVGDFLPRDIRHAPVTRDGEIPPPTDRTGRRRGSSRA